MKREAMGCRTDYELIAFMCEAFPCMTETSTP